MKTKTTQKIETIIEISKEDVLDMLRKTFPDNAYISHVESDDGEEIVGLEVTYYSVKS